MSYSEEYSAPLRLSPNTFPDQCLALVISDLNDSPTSVDLKVFYRVFNLLPDRIGKSRVLDSAIKMFTLHHLGKIHNDQRLVHEARWSYGESLARLRRALDHRRHWATTETFTAAMLICLYEMFAVPTAFNSWMSHAAGMARLAQMRGPKAFSDDCDRVVFVAFRGLWIMEALFGGHDTFLRDREWHLITLPRMDPRVTDEQHELMIEMGNEMTSIPVLVRDGIRMRENLKQGYFDATQLARLNNRGLKLYYRLKDWHKRWVASVGLPKEVPSSTGDKLFPVVFVYQNFAFATVFCGWYACMIILQELLKVCKYPTAFDAENAEMVSNICKSVEYNGSGNLGPYRMGFSIRIAMEVASVEIQHWIISWITQASKTYAVLSPQNFPKIEDRPTLDVADANALRMAYVDSYSQELLSSSESSDSPSPPAG